LFIPADSDYILFQCDGGLKHGFVKKVPVPLDTIDLHTRV